MQLSIQTDKFLLFATSNDVNYKSWIKLNENPMKLLNVEYISIYKPIYSFSHGIIYYFLTNTDNIDFNREVNSVVMLFQ